LIDLILIALDFEFIGILGGLKSVP